MHAHVVQRTTPTVLSLTGMRITSVLPRWSMLRKNGNAHNHSTSEDITYFGSRKIAYNRAAGDWTNRHPGQQITMYQLAHIYNKATQTVAPSPAVKALNGCKKSGIYPCNPHMFKYPEYITESGDGGDAVPLYIVVDTEIDGKEPDPNSLVNTDAQSDGMAIAANEIVLGDDRGVVQLTVANAGDNSNFCHTEQQNATSDSPPLADINIKKDELINAHLNLIPLKGDGRCLFRSIPTSCPLSLSKGRRDAHGAILNGYPSTKHRRHWIRQIVSYCGWMHGKTPIYVHHYCRRYPACRPTNSHKVCPSPAAIWLWKTQLLCPENKRPLPYAMF